MIYLINMLLNLTTEVFMDLQKMLARAIMLSAYHHVEQFDKGGAPYILHPLRVMENSKKYSSDIEVQIICVLHDIIEDTSVTEAELHTLGFSERVVNGVVAMSKVKGQSREQYELQVMMNADAVICKMSDLEDNSSLDRLIGITDKDNNRLLKYASLYYRLSRIYNERIRK